MSQYIKTPFRDALIVICGGVPPTYAPSISNVEMDDSEYTKLVEWIVNQVEWFTGEGVIEAAECLVQSAIENDNIRSNK